jgi:hypothetical protein
MNITDTIYYAEQFYEHVYDISDVIVLETLPQELSDKKYSYHVIFDGLMFASHLVCKDFFRRMKEESEMVGCDESIYNLGCLRIMGSSKKGEDRILKAVKYEISGKNTKVGEDLNFCGGRFFQWGDPFFKRKIFHVGVLEKFSFLLLMFIEFIS